MTGRGTSATAHKHPPSSAISSASGGSDLNAATTRKRNAKLAAHDTQTTSRTESTTAFDDVDSQPFLSATSYRQDRGGLGGSHRHGKRTSGDVGQFLGESWVQSWTYVQNVASNLLTGSEHQKHQTAYPSKQSSSRGKGRSASWGPTPPIHGSAINSIASGADTDRETALRAARTAKVLESRDGMNGGLDDAGRHKRRGSDDIQSRSSPAEDHLVYVHTVQPDDTYASIVLRYKCREDIFRKANGLWSRDSIQTRRWLLIPVDGCEIRGRPCEPPSWFNNQEADLLAPTPGSTETEPCGNKAASHDFFNHAGSYAGIIPKLGQDGYQPWTHVRWVQIESFRQPVEIARVARGSLGHFPHRRKKSAFTSSAHSTPRQSSELSSTTPASAERTTSRRPSSLGGGRPYTSATSNSSRSRVGSDARDNRPAWMRRPGGVGSMSRNIRAPGPDKDYFTSWAKKHLPALDVEGLPSMSVMGSETANFGFGSSSADIVESSFEAGRDAISTARQGTGLDRAAAAVKHWLRGALAKKPGTPLLGVRGRATGLGADGDISDLIELTDTASDDGRVTHGKTGGLLDSLPIGTESRNMSSLPVRGRQILSQTEGTDHKKNE